MECKEVCRTVHQRPIPICSCVPNKVMEKCELFVAESESFDRFSHSGLSSSSSSKSSGKSSKSQASGKSTATTGTTSDDDDDDAESGPRSIVYCAGSPVDRAASLEELRMHVEELEKREKTPLKKQGFFLGFTTRGQAEKEINRRGQFATYYRLPDAFGRFSGVPDESSLSLELNVVYLDTHLHFRHFVIRKYVSPSLRVFFQLGHSDPRKPTHEPVFITIKNLLKHYTLFGYVDSFTPEGGIRVEIFPK